MRNRFYYNKFMGTYIHVRRRKDPIEENSKKKKKETRIEKWTRLIDIDDRILIIYIIIIFFFSHSFLAQLIILYMFNWVLLSNFHLDRDFQSQNHLNNVPLYSFFSTQGDNKFMFDKLLTELQAIIVYYKLDAFL